MVKERMDLLELLRKRGSDRDPVPPSMSMKGSATPTTGSWWRTWTLQSWRSSLRSRSRRTATFPRTSPPPARRQLGFHLPLDDRCSVHARWYNIPLYHRKTAMVISKHESRMRHSPQADDAVFMAVPRADEGCRLLVSESFGGCDCGCLASRQDRGQNREEVRSNRNENHLQPGQHKFDLRLV